MKRLSNRELLETIQQDAFAYFAHETNLLNGLVVDRTDGQSPASVSAVGYALSAYPVSVERGWLPRLEARARTLATLRFLRDLPQGQTSDDSGYHGFFYHFLDMETGRRDRNCELSTIDSAMLFAGMLTAGQYFDQDHADEAEIRELVDFLYRRVNWPWALNGKATPSQGWRPDKGFLPSRWEGYNEGLLLYILALGSPTYPLPEESYAAWCSTYQWRTVYDWEYLYAGPLFIHHTPHLWIDFRDIQDSYMAERGMDYFENSRRAAYIHRQYAVHNPHHWKGYDADHWGLTASDGPGPAERRIGGKKRFFYNYRARGVPFGPDDGTLAPWAVVTSLPFAPEIVFPTLHAHARDNLHKSGPYGFRSSYNPTFRIHNGKSRSWESHSHCAINQGPIILAIENYFSGLIWRMLRRCPPIVTGLRRAGFRNGWLGA